MNAPASDTARGPRFWVLLAGTILAGQLLVIFLAAERPHAVPPGGPALPRLVLWPGTLGREELASRFLSGDPVLYAHPGGAGFSGSAWLNAPFRAYDLPYWDEPPLWLGLDAARLGASLTRFLGQNQPAPPPVAEFPTPVPSPILNVNEQVRAGSALRVEGPALAPGQEKPLLSVWETADVLDYSEVEVRINGRGEVLSTRLLAGSGSAEADREALRLARDLRFVPAPTASAGRSSRLVFQWQTRPRTPREKPAGDP